MVDICTIVFFATKDWILMEHLGVAVAVPSLPVWQVGIKPSEASDLFLAFDTDGSGGIDEKESGQCFSFLWTQPVYY